MKYLGIFIDDKLTWNVHINYINNKMSKSLGILHKIKHLLTSDTLLTLYYTLFYPYLQYCNAVWGMANKTTTKSLILLQKRVIRLISKSNWNDHTSPLFNSLKVLKVHDIYKLESLKLINDLVHDHTTTPFTSAFQAHVRHQYQTDTQPSTCFSTPRNSKEIRTILWLYAALRDDMKNICNSDTFKITTKKYLIRNY